ncbi:hypothetical protein U3516DRAFT_755870 [Neocallimastix sp. 'constans']
MLIWVKESSYRSILRDPQGKAESSIDGAGNCNPLRQGLRNGILIILEIYKTYLPEYRLTPNLHAKPRGKNREDLILTGVDPEIIIINNHN